MEDEDREKDMRITRSMDNADKVLGIFLREFRKGIRALHGELKIHSHRDDLESGYALTVDMDLDIARVHREATLGDCCSGNVMVYPLDLEAADPSDRDGAIVKGKSFERGQERKAAHFLAHTLGITNRIR